MPSIVLTPGGGGSAALQRAALMPAIARSGALPPLKFAAGGCNSLGGQCVINPAVPSMAMQISPPAGDLFYIAPVLSYRNLNTNIVNEIGTGRMHTFKRQVLISGTSLSALSGSGQIYPYETSRFGGSFANPEASSTVNSVQFTSTPWAPSERGPCTASATKTSLATAGVAAMEPAYAGFAGFEDDAGLRLERCGRTTVSMMCAPLRPNPGLGMYSARMPFGPICRPKAGTLALPARSGAEPSSVVPSKKFTEPPGVPPPLRLLTVAVNPTAFPRFAGFGLAVRTMRVA